MKIGFDIRSFIEKTDEKTLRTIKPDKTAADMLSRLVSQGHELLLFCPVKDFSADKKTLAVKKAFVKKRRSLIPFRFAFADENDLPGVAERNYIDIFVLSDKSAAERISELTDGIFFPFGDDMGRLEREIGEAVKKNREPVLAEDSETSESPLSDRLWLKHYRKGDLKWNGKNMSPYDRLTVSNLDWHDETAMEFFGRRFTYGEFFDRIDRLADIMLSDGIRKGIIVPIIPINCPDSLVVLYALYKIKATVAPIFPLSAKEDMQNKLRSICERNSANGFSETTLFMSELVFGRFGDILPKSIRTIVLEVTNFMPPMLGFAFRHMIMPKMGIKSAVFDEKNISFRSYAARTVSKQTVLDTAFDDSYTAVQLFTGGTIKPKGVRLSERSIDSAAKQFFNDRFAFRRGDKIAAFMPLNHSFGLIIGTHVAAALGVELDLIMKINFKRLDKLFLKDKVNLFGGIPNMFPAIRNNRYFENADLSHVKYILSGGALIDETEKQRTTEFFKAHNSSAEVHDGYGLTESAGGIIYDGIPNIGTDVMIAEPGTVRELGYEQVGELCMTGPQIMQGYDDDTLTGAALKKHSDGRIWLHTGDNALIHRDGRIEIAGRMDRMIKVNGEQVFLDDIEELINALDFVEKSAAVKRTDPKRGYVPVAFVKLKPGLEWTDERKKAVSQLYDAKLSAFARPRKTTVIKDFPVTAVGKIDLSALERRAEEEK